MRHFISATIFFFALLATTATAQVDHTIKLKEANSMGKLDTAGEQEKPTLRNFTNKELDKFPVYNGKDLGLTYSPAIPFSRFGRRQRTRCWCFFMTSRSNPTR
ncbi:MAG: hypothetical protein IPM82_00500 [Saprospiraceae bacterium]|nr:hypothetical protein [Saprospiraceae bacterium]